MLELKQISKHAIPRALAKAERYRLLNEPHEAESICRDVLRTEPGNQEAAGRAGARAYRSVRQPPCGRHEQGARGARPAQRTNTNARTTVGSSASDGRRLSSKPARQPILRSNGWRRR